MRIAVPSAAVLVITLFSSGCATAIYGTKQKTVVNSVPQGATAVSTKATCTTPCELLVHKKEKSITLSKVGYSDQIVPLRHRTHFGAFFFGNLLPFLGLGMIVDASTGGWWEIQPVNERLSRVE